MAGSGPSHSPLLNNSQPSRHFYMPDELSKILILAQRNMGFNRSWIFKLGYDPDAADFFKTSILPRLAIVSDPDELQLIYVEQCKTNPKFHNPEMMDHLWAHLVKIIFKECKLLDTNIDTSCSWQIFITDIKRIFTDYQVINEQLAQKRALQESSASKTTSYDYSQLDPIAIQTCFLAFIGQLKKRGCIQTAMLLHQFFFLLKSVAKEGSTNQMDPYQLGGFTGGSLYYALFRNLFPHDEIDKISGNELTFFAKICEFMLHHSIFNLPFHEADYSEFYQQNERYFPLRSSLLMTISRTPDMTSQTLFRTLYPMALLTLSGSEISREIPVEERIARLNLSSSPSSGITVVQNPLLPLLRKREENKSRRKSSPGHVVRQHSLPESTISASSGSSAVLPTSHPASSSSSSGSEMISAPPPLPLGLPAFAKSRRRAASQSDYTPRPQEQKDHISRDTKRPGLDG
jgi:hypothetical protein